MVSQVDISKALTIGGWMTEKELTWLASMANKHQYIVEFGVLYGRSCRALADNLPVNGKVWAVDPWAGDYYSEEGNPIGITTYVMPHFIHNLSDKIREGKVEPVREFSYRFSLPHKVDMVFIDGDHRYETVVKDIKKALELVKDGGLICDHDYNHPNWPGVKNAVDIWFDSIKLEDTIWSTIKS